MNLVFLIVIKILTVLGATFLLILVITAIDSYRFDKRIKLNRHIETIVKNVIESKKPKVKKGLK